MFRSYLSATIVACLLAVPATAQIVAAPQDANFADAYAEAAEARSACLEQDYETCYQLALPLAETGNPVAQNLVGIYYNTAVQDPAEYLYWLNRAAAQGLGVSLDNLAEFFTEDHPGYAPNIPIAVGYYRAAADQGYVQAYENLGWYLLYGGEEVEDYDRARALIPEAQAADPDNPYYDRLLADMYYFGKGEEVDYVRALELYHAVAETGDAYAQFSVGYQYYLGEGTEVDDARAVAFFQQAVDNEYPEAHGYLSEAHYYGYGVPVDYEQAYQIAAQGDALGDSFSTELMGYMQLHGEGTEQDFVTARATLERAFERGNVNALFHIGDMAYFGYGQEVDYAQAFEIFSQVVAANPGHANANYSIGYMMMRGEGGEADVAGSVPFIERAIEAGEINGLIEGPVLFGHPDYAGPHSDPVRAMGYCIYITDEGHLTDPDTQEDSFAACAHLQETLSTTEMLQAAAQADALKG